MARVTVIILVDCRDGDMARAGGIRHLSAFHYLFVFAIIIT